MAKLIRLENHPRATEVRSRPRQDQASTIENAKAKILRFSGCYPTVKEEWLCGPPNELKYKCGRFLVSPIEPYGKQWK